MIVELLRVQCGCGNTLTGLFDNHHAAIVAGERAGWLMQSESIGGDQCPRCLGREDVIPTEGVSPIRPAGVLLEIMKERDEAIARGVELWEHAADVTGWYDSALALVDLHEQWEAEALKERDEARAEAARFFRERESAEADLRQIRGMLPRYCNGRDLRSEFTTTAVQIYIDHLTNEIASRNQKLESALRIADRTEAERDEARAEAEHWRAMADVASPVLGDGPFPSLPWDANDNGTIDDADELAAYAEASDLRALAEREAVTADQTDSISFRVSDILPGYASVPVAGPLTDGRGFEVFEVRKGGDDE